MLKSILISLILIPQLYYTKENSKPDIIDTQAVITKLAEIDAKIDEMILKDTLDLNKINLSEIKYNLEKIFLDSKKIDPKEARLLWMYSGKIYIKINKFLAQNSKNFRLSPSDTQNTSPDLANEAKKTFAISKWLYLVSKDKKKSN